MKIAVIGSGVVGLTSAIRLLEHHHTVTIMSKDAPTQTTSSVAAAFWYPNVVSERVKAWCLHSLETFRALAKTASGVSLVSLYELDAYPEAKPHLELAGDLKKIILTFPDPWKHVYRATVQKLTCPFICPCSSNEFLNLVDGSSSVKLLLLQILQGLM
jgi:glycine/D-amino acid oxidase-like deaminating enzyme